MQQRTLQSHKAIKVGDVPIKKHPRYFEKGDAVYNKARQESFVVSTNDPFKCEVTTECNNCILYECLRELVIDRTQYTNEDINAMAEEEGVENQKLKYTLLSR